jgi:ribokinase
VIGSANVDFTVALPRLPRVGETVSAGTLLVNRGGKGANQAVAARRLGEQMPAQRFGKEAFLHWAAKLKREGGEVHAVYEACGFGLRCNAN